MTDSILTSVKEVLGVSDEHSAFDPAIIMHINATFSTLNQLGVGEDAVFFITDLVNVWDEFICPENQKQMVKTYMYLAVRLLFDPPVTSFAIEAMERQLKEFEWRLSIFREELEWVPPDPIEEEVEV